VNERPVDRGLAFLLLQASGILIIEKSTKKTLILVVGM
jgi:hypothetical protein